MPDRLVRIEIGFQKESYCFLPSKAKPMVEWGRDRADDLPWRVLEIYALRGEALSIGRRRARRKHLRKRLRNDWAR